MATSVYDAIVVGLGVMGAAVCRSLALRGLRVLGLEQFQIGHDLGSSHGRTRVIRKAYFEAPGYVPLAHQAFDAWRDLEKLTGQTLLRVTGCLNIGPADHECIRGVIRSTREHSLPCEQLDAREIAMRWPAFRPSTDDIGVFEPDAGVLFAEPCVQALAQDARSHGAVLRCEEKVERWKAGSSGVIVRTKDVEYRAEHLVLCAGPWLSALAGELGAALNVERQVQAWFDPIEPRLCEVGLLPVFIHFTPSGDFYGMPNLDHQGVKAAQHHGGIVTTADTVSRVVSPQDEQEIRDYLLRHLPAANGALRDAKICLYTNSPDSHFILDRHPAHANVCIAGGFSGHGFKFAPVVGEALADLVTGQRGRPELAMFRLSRFAG
jgi:sarcosine oxidase